MPRRFRRPALIVVAAITIVIALLVADAVRRVVEGASEQATDAPFYLPPTSLPSAARPTARRRSDRSRSAL